MPEIKLSTLKLGFPSSTTPRLPLIHLLSFSSKSYPQRIHFSTFLVLLVVVQLLSCVRLFVTSWTAALQASLSFLSPGVSSDSCLLSRWCHPTISPSTAPVNLLPSVFPSIRVFFNEFALYIKWPKYWSFSISCANKYSGLISFRIDWWLVWSPCSPRNSQESFPEPQFESISFSALSFLCGPTLTSMHDYWKNHSFDCDRALASISFHILPKWCSSWACQIMYCPSSFTTWLEQTPKSLARSARLSMICFLGPLGSCLLNLSWPSVSQACPHIATLNLWIPPWDTLCLTFLRLTPSTHEHLDVSIVTSLERLSLTT